MIVIANYILNLKYYILGCGYFSFWYTPIKGKETLITTILGYEWISWTSSIYLCRCRRAVLWLRQAVTSLFWCLLCCAKAGYINIYQTAAKNLSSIYVLPINWTIFFPHFCSSSPTPRSSFIQKLTGHTQTECFFYFSDAGNHLPFVYFLWLWSSDSSFLSSVTKQAFKPQKLQLPANLILGGRDGGSNKQLVLQKYCLFKS